MMRLSELQPIVGGELRGADTAFATVGIDTRSLKPGDLYVASVGPNGEHADTADGTRLAMLADITGGPAQIRAVQCGAGLGSGKAKRRGLSALLSAVKGQILTRLTP